jgi:hypothetical protein
MAEIVNLRRARRAKVRVERQRAAEANRLKFGQPKVEKDHAKLEDARARRTHDAHRREDETED